MKDLQALVLCVLVILANISCASILNVNHGVYTRVTVKVNEVVPRQFCHRALKNIEALLTSTSRQLFESSGGRFKDVTVILPRAWSNTECLNGRNVSVSTLSEAFDEADFEITGSHPIFGSNRPWALQFGECGVSGQGVKIPYHVLTESKNLSTNSVAATFLEWVRNRYGVFPEHGFVGDNLYPAFYQEGQDEITNIGCNLSSISEDFVLPLEEEQREQADLNNDLNESVGGHVFQFRTENQDSRQHHSSVLCEVEQYNRNAPSKQNILCFGKSAKEVMLAHPDFVPNQIKNFTDKIRNLDSFDILGNQGEFVEPMFKFVLPSEKRYVLVIDMSQAMARASNQRWEEIRNGLFRFFSHVPEGSEVAIVTFGAKAKINIDPTVVSESNREGLFGKIPFRLFEDQQGCIECGLQEARKLMTLPNSDGVLSSPSIVLLTATPASQEALRGLENDIETHALPVYNIKLSNDACNELDKLTLFGGNFAALADRSSEKENLLQDSLSDIFLAIINQNSQTPIKKSFHKSYIWKNQDVIAGNFVVEENLNKNLWLVLTTPFKEDVDYFEVTSPSAQKLEFPKVENGLVYFHLPGINEAGIWSYRAKLYPTQRNTRQIPIHIEVIAESNGSENVNLESWTNLSIDGEAVDATSTPVIIYAHLKQGDLPIRNARVVATIERPGMTTPVELELQDEGTGSPDITKGDGIYSAHFVDFTSEPGLYTVKVRATHNSGFASIPKPTNGIIRANVMSSTECCGSEFAADMYSIPTQSFEQYITGPSFKVEEGIQFRATEGGPERVDVFPPSRVTNFAVMNYVNQTLYATLSWSAPGGDYEHGRASKYEIKCYTNQEALSELNYDNMAIPVHESLLPKPSEYGNEQTATVGLPWANEVFYYGLVAIDESGNRSPVSNLVPVYAIEVITTPNNTVLTEDVEDGLASPLDNTLPASLLEVFGSTRVTYIVAGVISGILLIIIIILFVSVCRAKRRIQEKKKAKNQRTQIFVNDIESSSAALSELTPPEKLPPYGGIWTTTDSNATSTNVGGNHSPSSEISQPYRPNPSVMSDQASWAYLSGSHSTATTVPVHEYRLHSTSTTTEDPMIDAPTYQNWLKPPSDTGTATTSSTECYESDHSDKQAGFQPHLHVQQQYSNNNNHHNHHHHHHHPASHNHTTSQGVDEPDFYQLAGHPQLQGSVSNDPSNLSLSPSFVSASEKRRRQESLV